MAPEAVLALKDTAAIVEKTRWEGIRENMTPEDVANLRAAAAEAKKARWEGIREHMTPEGVATSRAAAAEAEKARWERNRKDMVPEEGEMVLAVEAYERRIRYQLCENPIALRMEELLRNRPVYTANDLVRDQEASAKRIQAAQQYVQRVRYVPAGQRCNFDSYETALHRVSCFDIGPMDKK